MNTETDLHTPNHFIKKIRDAKSKLGNRKGPNLLWLREKEDDSKLVLPDYNLLNGIPTMSRCLNDFEEGIICLAGRPNNGKSTILVNMMMQVLQLNDDVIVVDLSLDDPIKKRYEQYIASLTGLHYQEITTATDLTDNKRKLREQADELLESFYQDDRFRTYEAQEQFQVGDKLLPSVSMRRFDNIFNLMGKLRKKYPNKKIVLSIDAWNNLDYSGSKGGNDLSQTNYQLDALQEHANKYGIMVIVSAHLRKTTDKRPGLEDIKGTSNMAYNVVWAGIVRNEFREGVLKEPLLYKEADKFYPVVTIEIAKTKVSSWDMPLFYGLKSGQCQLVPLQHFEYEEMLDTYNGQRK